MARPVANHTASSLFEYTTRCGSTCLRSVASNADGGACAADCEQRLYLQRQLRETLCCSTTAADRFRILQDALVEHLDERVTAAAERLHVELRFAGSMDALRALGIDVVVGNLYPFASNPSPDLIDIGGPAMLRAAAKNHAYVTVLVDPADMGLTPKVMFIIDHSVKEGADPMHVVSRRMQFVEIDPKGNAINAGWAPHLDLEPLAPADMALIEDVLAAPWIAKDLEQVALAHASTHLVPEHFDEVRSRREKAVDKTLAAVHERLVREINFWSDRYIKLQDDIAAGKDVRLTLENVRRTIDDLTARRESREKELLAMRHVISATPVVVGGALVIPAGLLAQRKGEPESIASWTADADARARVEWVAMKAVMDAERALGHDVIDVSAQKCGWDVTSLPKAQNGKLPPSRHIEVKGRAKGSSTVTVTRNEILYGLNQQDKFLLAIVLVDGDQHEGPYYVTKPFTQEPDWAVTSINLDLDTLLARAALPETGSLSIAEK